VDEIAELISSDPASALDVLRGANSVYYSRVGGVSSLKEAVQVIRIFGNHTAGRVWPRRTRPRSGGCGRTGFPAGDYWSGESV